MKKTILHWSFVYLALTLVLPYLIAKPTQIFSIEYYVNPLVHILTSTLLVSILYVAVYLAGVGKGANALKKIKINYIQILVLCLFLFISIFTHLILIVKGFGAYLNYNFDDARRETNIFGIGIPLRFFILTIPLISTVYYKSYWFKLTCVLIVMLTFFRVVIFSERMALIELIATFWVVIYLNDTKIKFFNLIKLLFVVLSFFFIVLKIRLNLIDNYNPGVGDEGLLNLSLLYYADTMNKFYLTFFGDMKFYDRTLFSEILNFFGYVSSELDVYSNNPYLFSGLNNPGGLSQDVNSFTKYIFFAIFAIKYYLIAKCFIVGKNCIFLVMIMPVLLVQTLEYSRFNYISLPFVGLILCVSIILSLFLFLIDDKWFLQPSPEKCDLEKM